MSEVVGTLEGCVVLEGFIDREVTINLSTVDGTAIGIASCVFFMKILASYKFSCLYNHFLLL